MRSFSAMRNSSEISLFIRIVFSSKHLMRAFTALASSLLLLRMNGSMKV